MEGGISEIGMGEVCPREISSYKAHTRDVDVSQVSSLRWLPLQKFLRGGRRNVVFAHDVGVLDLHLNVRILSVGGLLSHRVVVLGHFIRKLCGVVLVSWSWTWTQWVTPPPDCRTGFGRRWSEASGRRR